MKYAPNIRVYGSYDFLNSNITATKYLDFLLQNNIKIASYITTNTLFGALEFYKLCQKHKIKPIIGMTLTNAQYHDQNWVITLFAQNFKGYQNLMKISSLIMNAKSNHNFPLQDHKLLLENIIFVVHDDNKYDSETICDFVKLLSQQYDNVVLGIVTLDNVSFYLEEGMENKLLPFNEVRYLFTEESKVYQIIQAIQQQTTIQDWKSPQLHFLDYETFQQRFDHGFFLNNLNNFLANINLAFKLPLPLNLRIFPIPKEFTSNFHYLSHLCHQKLQTLHLKNHSEYRERLTYELNVISAKKLVDYFLLVFDYVSFALKENILIGPGRGSAPGSLIAYLLGITKVDPLKYDLVFERFLNPKRSNMPDIDLDFEDVKRNQILEYLLNKYGAKHFAQITTFQRIALKMALRDVGRVLKINLTEINAISKEVALKWNDKFASALTNSVFLQASQKKYPDLFYFAQRIMGLPRQKGIHAAGVVIANKPLNESVALWQDSEQNNVIQAEMVDLEDLGLVKMDLLGLKNLTIISQILDSDQPLQNKNTFLSQISMTDNETFKILQKGDTFGIFQLESFGMTQLLKKIHPRNINDIATTISLYRPGPMANVTKFLERKNQREKTTYLFAEFQPILSDTYGIPIYQEQILKIVKIFSDLSYADGEILRRAISKKNEILINSVKKHFFAACQDRKRDDSLTTKVWKLLLDFANYGFNRSHAVAYSFIVYWMSYLKTHRFTAFMIALLDDAIGDHEKTRKYLFVLRRYKDIKLHTAHINYSGMKYRQKGKNVYLPFTLIKKVGFLTADKLIQMRQKEGHFKDLWDFFVRSLMIGYTKSFFVQMILSGALDHFNYNRTTLIYNLDVLILTAKYLIVDKDKVDWTLLSHKPPIKEKKEVVFKILDKEIDVFGFVVSYHYLNTFKTRYQNHPKNTIKLSTLERIIQNKQMGVFQTAVIIEKVVEINTRKRQKMAFLWISDETAYLKLLVWPEQFANNTFEPGALVVLEVMVKQQNNSAPFSEENKRFILSKCCLWN